MSFECCWTWLGNLNEEGAAVQGEGIRKKGLVGLCVVGTDLGYFKTEEAVTDNFNDGFFKAREGGGCPI